MVFQETVENSLGNETAWSAHEKIVVGVRRHSTFNNIKVFGLIEILQLRDGDTDQPFDDLEYESCIETTAQGARALAAALYRAAAAAEEVSA